jgi:cytochrome P450
MFSLDVSREADQLGQAVSFLMAYINRTMLSLMPLPLWVPTPANRKVRQQLHVMDKMIYQLINQRRSTQEPYSDLLSLLLGVKHDETGERMSDQHLRDEIITLFVAGHETTANALSWTFYLLSHNPRWEAAARREAQSVLGTRSASFDDIMRLPVIHSIVQEAMRLYPPAWIIGRQAIEEDNIGGYRIQKNAVVIISPYVLHRLPGVWRNPDEFSPERFFQESKEKYHRFAYIPFGTGPRVCIGSQFAMLETQLVIATILRDFRLELAPHQTVLPEPLITPRPKNGMKMLLRKAR